MQASSSSDNLEGQVPRLWSCPTSTAAESYNQDTRVHWKHLLQAPLGGSRGVVLLGSRVWRGRHWGGELLLVSTCLTVFPPITRGQAHTHWLLSITLTIKRPNPPPLSNKLFICIAGDWLLLVVEIGNKEGTCIIGRSIDGAHGRPLLAAATGNRMWYLSKRWQICITSMTHQQMQQQR
jgi:hypothetical protein